MDIANQLVQQSDRRKVSGGAAIELDMSNKIQTELERNKKKIKKPTEDVV